MDGEPLGWKSETEPQFTVFSQGSDTHTHTCMSNEDLLAARKCNNEQLIHIATSTDSHTQCTQNMAIHLSRMTELEQEQTPTGTYATNDSDACQRFLTIFLQILGKDITFLVKSGAIYYVVKQFDLPDCKMRGKFIGCNWKGDVHETCLMRRQQWQRQPIS